MQIDYDANKSATNLADRGYSFDLAAVVLANPVVEYQDIRREYGEIRMIMFGLVGGRLFNCVYTMRADIVWVISLRKANDREQRKWL